MFFIAGQLQCSVIQFYLNIEVMKREKQPLIAGEAVKGTVSYEDGIKADLAGICGMVRLTESFGTLQRQHDVM